jgi:hypothetical protein
MPTKNYNYNTQKYHWTVALSATQLRGHRQLQHFTVCFGSHFYYSCTLHSLGMIHVSVFLHAVKLVRFQSFVFYAMPWQTGVDFAPACWDAVLGEGKFCPCSLAQCVSG